MKSTKSNMKIQGRAWDNIQVQWEHEVSGEVFFLAAELLCWGSYWFIVN